MGEVIFAGRPAEAAERVLRLCAERVGAVDGCVHLVDPGSGRFSPFVRLGEEFGPAGVEGIDPPAGEIGILSEFFGQDVGVEGIAVYVRRGRDCVAVLVLPGVVLDRLGDNERRDLCDRSALLGNVFQDARLLDLLQAADAMLELGARTGVDRWEPAFLEEAGEALIAHSGMERLVLHELDRESGDVRLHCVLHRGFEKSIEAGHLEFPVEGIPAYEQAVFGTITAIADLGVDQRPFHSTVFQPARSLVVLPVRAGGMQGALTFLGHHPFHHSPLELHGFETVANALGLALSNRRNLAAAISRDREDAEMAQSVTALEIARSGRHAAKGYIDNSIKASSLLWSKCRDAGINVEPELDAIASSLKRARSALDQVGYVEVGREPSERVPIRTVWEGACVAYGAQLQREGIEAGFVGFPAEVEVSSEGLRLAFLNLIINSVEAFRNGRRSGRLIELKVEPLSARDRDIRIVYRDNGPGVNRGKLRPADQDRDLSHLLFEKGVSSKEEGLGLGLWLVRRALKREGGSIDLLRSHDGARFAIRLPNPDN